MGEELVYQPTGELIALDDAKQCARIFNEIKDYEEQLRYLKDLLKEALFDESRRQGIKTMHFPGAKVVIGTPVSIVWDQEILAELREAGLPEERMDALITQEVSYKVNGSVAKQLSGSNGKYKEIIERAQTRIERSPSVTVTAIKGEASDSEG